MFPDFRKKSKVVTIDKQTSKNLIQNYWAISLFLISRDGFQRLAFSSLFNYVIQNKLFAEMIYLLLSISQYVYHSLHCNQPTVVKRIFFDISKAFDKVWDEF